MILLNGQNFGGLFQIQLPFKNTLIYWTDPVVFATETKRGRGSVRLKDQPAPCGRGLRRADDGLQRSWIKHNLPWGGFEAKPMWTKTDDKTTDKKVQFEDMFDLSKQLNHHMPRQQPFTGGDRTTWGDSRVCSTEPCVEGYQASRRRCGLFPRMTWSVSIAQMEQSAWFTKERRNKTSVSSMEKLWKYCEQKTGKRIEDNRPNYHIVTCILSTHNFRRPVCYLSNTCEKPKESSIQTITTIVRLAFL